MRQTIDRAMLREGYVVYDHDGNHVGSVNEVAENYVLVQKGKFFPRDVYVPVIAIERVEGEKAWINVHKDEIDSHGWDGPPSTDLGTTARIPVQEGEVEIRKVARQDTEQVGGTVRREEVEVTRENTGSRS